MKDMMNRKLTKFEWKVLKATLSIPFGQTRSYKWVAEQIGHPKAVRAVGSALRKNPYPLIIPCHRVIKSDGTLGGYCGTNTKRKKELLDRERYIISNLQFGNRRIRHESK